MTGGGTAGGNLRRANKIATAHTRRRSFDGFLESKPREHARCLGGRSAALFFSPQAPRGGLPPLATASRNRRYCCICNEGLVVSIGLPDGDDERGVCPLGGWVAGEDGGGLRIGWERAGGRLGRGLGRRLGRGAREGG